MGLRDKNHPGPPTSAYPDRKGICRSESCRGTLSDKGLSQGQAQPCDRQVEPEIPVPRASWDMSAEEAGARLQGPGGAAGPPRCLGLRAQPWVLSLSGSFSCLRPPSPTSATACLSVSLAISQRHGHWVFLKLSVHPQS